MIVDLPGTTVGALASRLQGLREDTGAMALSRVLTLVIVVDDEHAEDTLQVATQATHQHPSRIVCVVNSTRRGKNRIDGQIRVGGDAGASEIVVLRLFGEVNSHAESVVLPFLLPDSPVVAWWPQNAPKNPAQDPVGALARRRITDAEHSSDPLKTIFSRPRTYAAGDTDLAWTRVTRWRGILAAALEQPPFEAVTHVTVCGGEDSASTDLIAGWLAHRLACTVTRDRAAAGSGLLSVVLERESGSLELIRPDGLVAVLSQPGQPVRRIALARRTDEECLADELARLDPDEVYEETLVKGIPLVKGSSES
ncbi:glucose-6-phosphate dehydrogenase assembly protein OpcA [Austwickia chelonae]|uniref:glucose-6-phosphate dehydrogenase assembly protein OpcA n=1 Tax=Austwickia chelonae TaxID=100225 RepID=UPI000E22EAD1|nr:glucose-6-phosphate dehydrogenase assembly protein OpcA [Austwickia chelonae]